jgi:hypothetical protein
MGKGYEFVGWAWPLGIGLPLFVAVVVCALSSLRRSILWRLIASSILGCAAAPTVFLINTGHPTSAPETILPAIFFAIAVFTKHGWLDPAVWVLGVLPVCVSTALVFGVLSICIGKRPRGMPNRPQAV